MEKVNKISQMMSVPILLTYSQLGGRDRECVW